MIATLPMYDWPEQSGRWDRFWHHLRDALGDRGIDAPSGLTRDPDLWTLWQSPDLVIGQTCGLPYRTRLHGRVTLLGAFDLGLPGCPPGQYNSVIVVRRGGPASMAEASKGIVTYSVPDSQSGWAALHAYAGSHVITLRRGVQSGAHRLSARLVAAGAADLAAIDAETWRLIETYDADTAGALRVLDRTPPTPGLPLISRAGVDPAPYVAAIRSAIAGVDAETRAALHIRGFVEIPADTYLALPNPPAPPPP